jgi:microcystin-dependent protein
MPIHNHNGSTGETTGANTGKTSTSMVTGHDVADDGSHSHSIDPDGGDGAHNNMQPFLVLRYLIKY